MTQERKQKKFATEKHPPSQPTDPESIINTDLHPVLFESIDASVIKSAK